MSWSKFMLIICGIWIGKSADDLYYKVPDGHSWWWMLIIALIFAAYAGKIEKDNN